MVLAQPQPHQKVASIVEVVLLYSAFNSRNRHLLSSRPVSMEEAVDTETGSKGRLAAVAERVNHENIDAKNHANSG